MSLFVRCGGGEFGAATATAMAVEGTIQRNLRKWDPRNPVSTAKLVGITVSEIVGVGCDLVSNMSAMIALTVSLSAQVVLVGEEEMNMVMILQLLYPTRSYQSYILISHACLPACHSHLTASYLFLFLSLC